MTKLPLAYSLTLIVMPVVFLAPGCARTSGRTDMGSVQGTITYEGSPLRGGTIHFIQSRKTKISLWIRADGTYSGDVPLGPAKVAIETESVQYKDREFMLKKWQETVGPNLVHKKKQQVVLPGEPAEKMVYTRIPERYSNPEQSGLRVEVHAGNQQCDFALEGPAGSTGP
jgi:hypothetical protein